ncbi:MAG TPA: hypothetical protein DD827_00445 [Gammaproteobacteria bacterium]|jgi:flagellar assembly protein FliH|nr:hypothetical protein [Gammaproteobacteria bacterium]
MTNIKQPQSSQPWNLPPIGNTDSQSVAAFVRSTFSSPSSLDQQQDLAVEEGFQKGYEEGLLAAQNEVSQQQTDLTQTLELLRNPLKQIDAQIEHELVELSLAVAKQILRREIKTEPQHIVGLIRTAVEQLPPGDPEINIHLHPEDAGAVEKTLKKYDANHQWNIIKDPATHRTDCKIHAEPSFIDASAEAIINRLAVDILGGERSDDRPPTEQTN